MRSHGSARSGGEVWCSGLQEGCGAYGQVGWTGLLQSQGCCWSPSASVDSGSAVHMSAGSLSSVKLAQGSRSIPALAPWGSTEPAAIRTGWSWAGVSNSAAKAERGTQNNGQNEEAVDDDASGTNGVVWTVDVGVLADQKQKALDQDIELAHQEGCSDGAWAREPPDAKGQALVDPCKPEQLAGIPSAPQCSNMARNMNSAVVPCTQ